MKEKTEFVLKIEKDDPKTDIFKIQINEDSFKKDHIKGAKEFINFFINKITGKECKIKLCKTDNNILCEIRKPVNK